MTRKECLQKAHECVCIDRNAQYGEPEDNFALVAELWRAYISQRCVPNGNMVEIGAKDVADMMVLFKVARAATAIEPSADTYTDIAGYAACACEIATKGGD